MWRWSAKHKLSVTVKSKDLKIRDLTNDRFFEKHIWGGGGGGGGRDFAKNVQFMQYTCISTLVHEDILFLSLFELVS